MPIYPSKTAPQCPSNPTFMITAAHSRSLGINSSPYFAASSAALSASQLDLASPKSILVFLRYMRQPIVF